MKRLLIAALLALGCAAPAAAQWDATKPATGQGLVSADFRNNWSALQGSLNGINLVRDPTFIIWPTANAVSTTTPAVTVGHWQIIALGGGTSSTLTQTGTGLGDTNRKVGKYAAKVTAGTGGATVQQSILNTTDYDDGFDGVPISMGGWVRCTVATSGRLRIGTGGATPSVWSAYHTGGGGWEWLTVTVTLPSDSTMIQAAMDVSPSQSCHLAGASMVIGSVPPSLFIPTQPVVGTERRFLAGVQTVGTGKIGMNILWDRPVILRAVQLIVQTAQPATQALIVQMQHWDGSAWQAIFTTRPQVAAAASLGAPAPPDGTYRYRCFQQATTATLTDTWMRVDVDQVGTGTAGTDLHIVISFLYFPSPLEPFLSHLSVS